MRCNAQGQNFYNAVIQDIVHSGAANDAVGLKYGLQYNPALTFFAGLAYGLVCAFG